MAQETTEIRKRMAQETTEIKTRMAQETTEINTRLAQESAEIKEEITTRLAQESAEIKEEITTRMARETTEIKEEITTRMAQHIDERINDMSTTLSSQVAQDMFKQQIEEKRKRLLEHTENSIKMYTNENTFVHTNALNEAMKRVKRKGIVILIGPPGIGKSCIGLELLRQISLDNGRRRSIQLDDISQWQDMSDDMDAVFIDDVFGRTNCSYNDNVHSKLLEMIYTANQNKNVKVILTLRTNIYRAIATFIVRHRIFTGQHVLDLGSDKHQMTVEEKKSCLRNYLTKNNILETDDIKKENINDDSILDTASTVYLHKGTLHKILHSDIGTQIGFPETCYLFASHRKFTKQGHNFFCHPMEQKKLTNLRLEGDTNERDIHNFGLETTEDFTEIMQKGSYKCYWNRVYLVGNYNVGKTTLAKILVGDQVPEVRTSTDGIWLYIGLAGMDIEERRWVYLPKGNAMRTVLTTMLMSMKSQKAEEDVASERNKDSKGNSAQTTMMQEEEQLKNGDQFKASSSSTVDERNRSEGTSSLESALDANLVGNVLETMSNEKLRELVVEAAKEGKYKMKIVPIDIWDFGGQKDYYMTHQLFINSRGIFVLMFNGSHDIHKHMPDLAFLPGHHGKPTIAVYLKHWVNSILTYCRRTKNCFPRVLFVATHRDMIPEANLKVHREKLVKSIDDLFRDHAKRGHLEYNSLLFINATDASDPEIDMLRQKLIERVFEHPSWGEEMPTAWIPLELELAQEVEKGNSIISKEQIEALNDRNESFKLNDKQLVSFLKIQHALGKLIYFDDVDLRNFIVINPVYMIEIVRSIVTDKQFWPRGERFMEAHEKLRLHGIIDKSTIFAIWEQEEFRHILPHKDYVLNILVHLDIIVAPRTGLESLHKPISTIGFFLVPCMITNPDHTDYMTKACTQASSIILAYTFVDDVIPPALSYRFLGSCLTMWDLKVYKGEKMIFSDLAVVEVGQSHDVAVQVKEERVVVYLVHSCRKDSIVPILASSVQECLTSTIHRISEFYSSLAEEGTRINSTDIKKPFEIEFGVFCRSSICFFHPSKLPSTLNAHLQCKQHQMSHTIPELHHWYAEKKQADGCPETCKGLGLLEMEQRPSDKHIRRLIAELSPNTCRQLAIFLGLRHHQWENLEIEFQHDNIDNMKFMAVWKWKQRDRKACFNHLKDALDKCSCNDHYLCQAFRDIDIDTDLCEETLDSVPSIQSLTAVSDYIGNSSLQLGIELGLEVPELENIQIQLRNKPLDQTREILLRWSKYDHVDHKLRTLVKALERIGKSSCLNDINF